MVGITGIGSGIDIDSIVKAMVNAERAPKELQLNRLEQATTSRISALGSLRSVTNEFNTALSGLKNLSAFQRTNVSSSNSSVLTATATGTLTSGRFSLQVEQLASSSKVALQSVSGPLSGTGSATFNSGSISISAGTSSLNVAIDATNNSLTGIRDAINSAGESQGISATIVSDTTGSRLILSSNKTGAGNDIAVSVSEDGVSTGSTSLGVLNYAANETAVRLPAVAGGATATFKAGTLNLSSGSNAAAINIADEMSLNDVMAQINSQGGSQGFSASLEGDLGKERLVIRSSNGSDLSVTVAGGDSGLGANDLSTLAAAGGANSRAVDTAKSALFKVDGIAFEKTSNSVADAIDGITLNLVSAQSADDIAAGKTINVTVGEDRGLVRSNLQRFVDAYNKLISTTSELTAVVSLGEGKKPVTGPLLGDTSVRNLLAGVRKEMGQLGEPGGIQSLAQLGITTGKDGRLSLDGSKLDAALAGSNYAKAAEFLAGEKGLMSRLESVVSPYVSTGGVLDERQKGLQGTVSNIDKQREALNLRIEKVQARLFAQYNAMDMLVGRLQKTSESLANQLASLPGFVKKDK